MMTRKVNPTASLSKDKPLFCECSFGDGRALVGLLLSLPDENELSQLKVLL